MNYLQTFFEKRKNWQIALAIFFLGFVLYANTFNNQLFWDDFDSIVNNQYIRDWNYFPKYFSENLTAGAGIRDNYWRPLLLISFSLDYHLGGLTPFVYHLQNFFWHSLSAFLMYILLAKIFKNKVTGFFSALLFLFHPLQTEAVAYVAGRADPMQAALLLLSFWFFLPYVEGKDRRKNIIYSLIFFASALLVKERSLVFPAILLIYLFTLHSENIFQDWQKKLKNTLPFLLIAFVYFLLRLTVLHFADTFDLGQPNNIGADNFGEKILIYLKGLSVYFGLLFWPAKLYMEKTISVPSSFFDWSVFFGFTLALSSVLVIFYSLKKKRIAAFGMLWFWTAFSPSFYIYPIQGLLYEHWLYFPMIGLLISFLIPLFAYLNKKNSLSLNYFVISVFAFFVLGLGGRTILRNNDWENPISFYEKNIALGGTSGRVYTNLGLSYAEAGENEKAIGAYKKAIALNENLFQPWYDLGNTFSAMGQNEKALAAYAESIKINPYFTPAYNNSVKIFIDQKKFFEAIALLEKANETNPQNIQLLYNLGAVYYQSNNKVKAAKYFREALSLDPTNPDLIRLVNNL
jgi:tetratricopeptide (TPR) repeat protein